MFNDMRQYRSFTKILWDQSAIIFYAVILLSSILISTSIVFIRFGGDIPIELILIIFSYTLFYSFLISVNKYVFIFGLLFGVINPYISLDIIDSYTLLIGLICVSIVAIYVRICYASDDSNRRKGQMFGFVAVLFAIGLRLKYQNYQDINILFSF